MPGELLRPLNFARTEAAGTNPKPDGLPVYACPHRLQIGLPDLFRTDMGMADLHADRFAFTAYITLKSHSNTFFRNNSHQGSILNPFRKCKRIKPCSVKIYSLVYSSLSIDNAISSCYYY